MRNSCHFVLRASCKNSPPHFWFFDSAYLPIFCPFRHNTGYCIYFGGSYSVFEPLTTTLLETMHISFFAFCTRLRSFREHQFLPIFNPHYIYKNESSYVDCYGNFICHFNSRCFIIFTPQEFAPCCCHHTRCCVCHHLALYS